MIHATRKLAVSIACIFSVGFLLGAFLQDVFSDSPPTELLICSQIWLAALFILNEMEGKSD